jgi:hypothetical protein
MRTTTRQTRENRTITIDFRDEATYVQLLGDGKAFLEGVPTIHDDQLWPGSGTPAGSSMALSATVEAHADVPRTTVCDLPGRSVCIPLVVYPRASEVTEASGLTGSARLSGAMRASARGETTAQERRPLAQAACFSAGLAARRPGAATLRHPGGLPLARGHAR